MLRQTKRVGIRRACVRPVVDVSERSVDGGCRRGWDDGADHDRMNRTVIRAAAGVDGHRLTRRARVEIAGVERPVIQDDAMRDAVDVVPDDHLTGRQGRRIR